MKVINFKDLVDTERQVKCPNGGFTSYRYLLEEDKMGFTTTKTIIPVGKSQHWHYKEHLEACYCVSGEGVLTDNKTMKQYDINPETMYVLDNNDDHFFQATKEVVLICVFNPPLVGKEVHDESGSYSTEQKDFKSPVYNVLRVPADKVVANDYNPNKVAPPEMELLEISIWEDGYTQPIVTIYDDEKDIYIVVDGFHRHLTMQHSERIRVREKNMLPIVVIDKAAGDRMASTIRHNRARGSHNIELMSVIVTELVEMGKGDPWICKHVGMSADELLRMKQITGLSSLFQNKDFSDSWEADTEDDGVFEHELQE